MGTLIGDHYGLVHLIAGILAVILGGAVLLLKKGSKLHKQIGYAYCVSMVVLIVTSFMIYRLFHGFGVFHFFSIVATFSLAMGMVPMFKRQRTPADYETHFTRMYFSVVGLYAAFAAESFVRIPSLGTFWQVVAWSFVLVLAVSMYVFFKKRGAWSQKFGKGRANRMPSA
jgi:uncharacterized membrane protein